MKSRGMTLIEVLVALAVSSVALLGALALLGVMFQGGTFARNTSEASVLAQSHVEDLVSLSGVTLASPAPSTVVDTVDAFGNLAGGATYTRTTTWGFSADGQRRLITVTVAWKDGLGRPHAVTATRERSP
jgi:prepilin-type N-terminal cleavage/methylation domain-containing protein